MQTQFLQIKAFFYAIYLKNGLIMFIFGLGIGYFFARNGKFNNMSIVIYIIWLIAFLGGVIAAFFVPAEVLAMNLKFIFIGSWGAVLGLVLYSFCRHRLMNAEADFSAALNEQRQMQSPRTQYLPVVNPGSPDFPPNGFNPTPNEVSSALDAALPVGAMPAKDALASCMASGANVGFPLDTWDAFCKDILKNRPFSEVIVSLGNVLPSLFPNSSGILYMYGGTQTELHKILSFGDYAISDDVIMPAECASFNMGEIVVTDFAKPTLSGGCTHLHHHPHGISFCAPVEGLEEHFGILSIQTDALPDGESQDFWKAKVSIVAATFGLYVANQNLSIRFQQHSIRDSLTGLFNRRYMEESLRRELASARRHQNPIGIIMVYPDTVASIQKTRGRHAVDQLLWELGQRIPGFIRFEDIPCRYEGDAFCVILPGADFKITRSRAERIRYEISQLQIAYGDTILSTTLSVGVTVALPGVENNVENLITRADDAMKLAISSGTNRVVIDENIQK